MNICMFAGRLVRDAESKQAKTGTLVTTFTIAVESGYGDHQRTDYIRCKLFKRDGLVQHLTKGKPVMVRGEYAEQRWEDKDGNRQHMAEWIVSDLWFQNGTSGQQAPRQQSQPESTPLMIDEVPF